MLTKRYYRGLPIENSPLSEDIKKLSDEFSKIEKALHIQVKTDLSIEDRFFEIDRKLHKNKPQIMNKPKKPPEPKKTNLYATNEGLLFNNTQHYDQQSVTIYYSHNNNYKKEMEIYETITLPEYERELEAYQQWLDDNEEWENITYTYEGEKVTRADLKNKVVEAYIERQTEEDLNTFEGILAECERAETKTNRTDSRNAVQSKLREVEVRENQNHADKIRQFAEILIKEYQAIRLSFGGGNSRLGDAIEKLLTEEFYIDRETLRQPHQSRLEVPTVLELTLNIKAGSELTRFYAITNQYNPYAANLERAKNLLQKANEEQLRETKQKFMMTVTDLVYNVELWNRCNPKKFKSPIPTGVKEMKPFLQGNNPDNALPAIQAEAKKRLAEEKSDRTAKTTEFYEAIASLDIKKLKEWRGPKIIQMEVEEDSTKKEWFPKR